MRYNFNFGILVMDVYSHIPDDLKLSLGTQLFYFKFGIYKIKSQGLNDPYDPIRVLMTLMTEGLTRLEVSARLLW